MVDTAQTDEEKKKKKRKEQDAISLPDQTDDQDIATDVSSVIVTLICMGIK
jgi:hypothetical protein